MTTTTAAAKVRSIPAEGIELTIGDLQVKSFWVNSAGWTIQIRRGGAFESAQMHAHEHQAVDAINTLIAKHEAQAEQPAAEQAKLTAPENGATKMSPAEVVVIGQALDSTGKIRRGRGAASADIASLIAMARRGFITLTGPAYRPNGGEVTDWGKRIHKETVAEQDAQRDRDAKLAAIALIAA